MISALPEFVEVNSCRYQVQYENTHIVSALVNNLLHLQNVLAGKDSSDYHSLVSGENIISNSNLFPSPSNFFS